MQTELVRQIANEALAAALFDNWVFYALLAALSLITSAVGAYAGGYWKRRAETAAAQRDMQVILDQLKQTTQVAEEVRAQVSHADWIAREWRTVRRTKLEELLVTSLRMEEWLDRARKKWILLDDVAVETDVVDRFTALVALYFPELETEAQAVVNRYRLAYTEVLDCSGPIRDASVARDLDAHQAAFDAFNNRWATTYTAARSALKAFEAKCGQVMQALSRATP